MSQQTLMLFWGVGWVETCPPHDPHGCWRGPAMQTEQWFCKQIAMVFQQNREEKRAI